MNRKIITILIFMLSLPILVFSVFPVYTMVLMSLRETYVIDLSNLAPVGLTLKNFWKLFTTTNVPRWTINSIVYALTLTFSNIILSAMAAFAFARLRFKGRDKLFFLVVATIFIPGYTILLPLYLMIVKLGLASTLLGLVLPDLVGGFNILLVRQYMLSIPESLYDAAKIDGCTDFQVFYKIFLPMCKSVLILVGTFTFLWSWNSFIWPLIMMSSSNNYTLPVGISLFSHLRGVTNIGLIMAASTFTFLPPVIVFFIFQKYIVKGMVLSGIKA